VRDYLVAQLSALSMQPQVSTAIGVNGGFGAISVGNTRNIVARLPGTANSGAVLLMAHYDSVPNGPGAADDGAGVSAILETVRALKTGPALKNDLIVLFTDGEEPGLLGAEAFVASHPWMKDIGLVMNFEARGNRGASLLFETSVNNASLMNEVAHAAPSPIASSLFYSLYKLLPNSTDFNMFRPAGIPGLNFAFGGTLKPTIPGSTRRIIWTSAQFSTMDHMLWLLRAASARRTWASSSRAAGRMSFSIFWEALSSRTENDGSSLVRLSRPFCFLGCLSWACGAAKRTCEILPGQCLPALRYCLLFRSSRRERHGCYSGFWATTCS
jgi:hypothetical protein